MTETAQELVARLTGWTPGPWRTGTNNPYRVYDGGSQSVLHMDPPFNEASRYESNAALIAAAPDLHRELTAALAREAGLREALAPFAAFAALAGASRLPDDHVLTVGSRLAAPQLTVGHMRKARAALETKP